MDAEVHVCRHMDGTTDLAIPYSSHLAANPIASLQGLAIVANLAVYPAT